MKSQEYKRQLQEALGGVNASCATSTDTTADRGKNTQHIRSKHETLTKIW